MSPAPVESYWVEALSFEIKAAEAGEDAVQNYPNILPLVTTSMLAFVMMSFGGGGIRGVGQVSLHKLPSLLNFAHSLLDSLISHYG